jgi:5-hydroxyisourate hydrolase-like protein (transthyretin family)
MIYLKISSVVTTKVKGQGFVPVNRILDKFSNNNVQEYKKMFEIRPDIRYKILDTAGNYFIPILFINLIYSYFLTYDYSKRLYNPTQ